VARVRGLSELSGLVASDHGDAHRSLRVVPHFFLQNFLWTMDKPGAKAFLLHLGVFALAIPLVVVLKTSRPRASCPHRFAP
jgi:hypothetical protein